jgi:predicted nuclease of restriction endonuclease-like (RecB) superfamily
MMNFETLLDRILDTQNLLQSGALTVAEPEADYSESFKEDGKPMNFETLLVLITDTQQHLQRRALQSVNQLLTIRNWLIGLYIVEYEQHGSDRAKYGKKLLQRLAQELKENKIKGMSQRNLYLYKEFYLTYPQILQSVTAKLQSLNFQFVKQKSIGQTLIAQSQIGDIHRQNSIVQSVSAQLQTPNEYSVNSYSPDPVLLLQHFTFTHFAELLKIDDPLKRAFYEIEGIKGNWSVRQLRRQIESLLYERTGLSTNKEELVRKVHQQRDTVTIEDLLRDPYILEFTGLQERPEYSEHELETALLNHLQEFLLELGTGFCFEARQKRISIDNEHDRIDLVFYHRILRCHVLIDLKIRAFTHGDAGQMNFYLNYFKDNIMTEQDNPPVGIILCTEKNTTKVHYATGGLENDIFVSKYLIALPSEQELEAFIEQDRERIEAMLGH